VKKTEKKSKKNKKLPGPAHQVEPRVRDGRGLLFGALRVQCEPTRPLRFLGLAQLAGRL
jgi:hypothetical protein